MSLKADLVLVEWRDAHGPPDQTKAWFSQKEALDYHEPSICCSVGWVLKRDKRGITLFSSMADADNIGEVQFVYAGMIKKVTVLKKARRQR